VGEGLAARPRCGPSTKERFLPACQTPTPTHTRPAHPLNHPPSHSFEFADGKLSCRAAPASDGAPPGTLASDLTIERVVVLGLPGAAYEVTLTAGGKSRRLAAGAGGVDPGLAPEHGRALVVRASGAPLGRDWDIQLKPAAS
jgi:hypothetical protein